MKKFNRCLGFKETKGAKADVCLFVCFSLHPNSETVWKKEFWLKTVLKDYRNNYFGEEDFFFCFCHYFNYKSCTFDTSWLSMMMPMMMMATNTAQKSNKKT